MWFNTYHGICLSHLILSLLHSAQLIDRVRQVGTGLQSVNRAYLISPLLRLLSISRACPPSNVKSSVSRLVERRFTAFVGSGGMSVGNEGIMYSCRYLLIRLYDIYVGSAPWEFISSQNSIGKNIQPVAIKKKRVLSRSFGSVGSKEG